MHREGEAMNTKFTTPAVVLGLSPTGLYAVRELGRAGIKVIGVSSERQCGCRSRYLSQLIIEPDESLRLEKLVSLFRNEPTKAVLIPTSDKDIEFVARYHNELSVKFVFQNSYTLDFIQTILTKENFYRLCEAEGIQYPKLWRSLPSELKNLRDKISYPCIIKPSRIHEVKDLLAGKKGWIAENCDGFSKIIKEIPASAGVLLLQEIIPGPESNITLHATYVDRGGHFQQPISAHKLRQYPPGFGSASLVITSPENESRDIARHILKKMGYHGIAASEFKLDPRDNRLKIIEINARPSLWFAVSSEAGKHLTLAAYHDLAETGYKLAENPQRNNVIWRYVIKDLYSNIFYLSNKNFILPAPDIEVKYRINGNSYAVFSIDDPFPVLSEWYNLARKALIRVSRKSLKKNIK